MGLSSYPMIGPCHHINSKCLISLGTFHMTYLKGVSRKLKRERLDRRMYCQCKIHQAQKGHLCNFSHFFLRDKSFQRRLYTFHESIRNVNWCNRLHLMAFKNSVLAPKQIQRFAITNIIFIYSVKGNNRCLSWKSYDIHIHNACSMHIYWMLKYVV
jgi:hypothetical protein